ncbi:MAG: hypothetical protein EHM28_03645 [Spirochaetaceae bacterium]|nr:MAG: hypothetical protein EHM28_03645 [Spirochaetaceae bacterium]
MREITFHLTTIEKRVTNPLLEKKYLETSIYISSPWLLLFLCFALAGFISYIFKSETETDINYGTLMYAFTGALFISGTLSLPLLKYIMFQKPSIAPHLFRASLVGQLILVALIAFGFGAGIFLPSGLPVSYKIFSILFFILFTCSQLLFMVQASLKYFPLLSAVFFGLSVLVPLAGMAGKALFGSSGFILALTTAQMLVFFIQWYISFHEATHLYRVNLSSFRFTVKDPVAIAIGFFCTTGFLMDKIIYWATAPGTASAMYPIAHDYNIGFFLAFCTAMPAFLYFFVFGEKTISRYYRRFYEQIWKRETADKIEREATGFLHNLLNTTYTTLQILLVSVFLCSYFATHLFSILGLSLDNIGVFRTAAWGNALYIMFTLGCILLYYMDFQKQVLWLYALFFGLNIILSGVCAFVLDTHSAYSFAIASAVCLLVTILFLVYCLRNLLYIHFLRHPLGYQLKKPIPQDTGMYLLKKD